MVKGSHHTLETKRKIRSACKGKKLSEEHVAKIIEARKDYVMSKETKRKIREAVKGVKNHNYGKFLSEKIRRKMSKSREGKKNHFYGKHHTKGTKQKISTRLKRRTPWNKGKKLTKGHIRNMMRRRIPSSLEKEFQQIVDRHSLPYRFVGDGSFLIENCNPDFVNTNSRKIAVEVYARYYKSRNNISIEEWREKRTKIFTKYGWDVIFFDETEVKEENVLEVLK